MDNLNLFYTIHNLSGQNPILDRIMIFGAQILIYFTIFLVIALGIIGKDKEKKALFLTIVSFSLALFLAKIIRIFYFQPRPFITIPDLIPLIPRFDDPSFPSMHTLSMAIMAFSFAYYKSRFAPILLFFLLWVGFSRIYVGVHYPLDVLGGVIVALLSINLVWYLKKYFQRRLSGN